MRVSSSLIVILALSASWTAFGAGGGSSLPSSMPSVEARTPPSPEERARTAYDLGVRSVQKADRMMADAARQSDARKQQKARDKAQRVYRDALRKFERAAELRPNMHEAWNYVGYCRRKLGDFDAALAAYDRALTLEPDYAPAIEYRGHAWLGLGRLEEAKQAYLSLFAGNRALADSLLDAMRQWVAEHHGGTAHDGTATVSPAAHAAFATWVEERGTIANQTASLTREGAKAAWR